MGKTTKTITVTWDYAGDPARILGWNVVVNGSATDPYSQVYAQVFRPRPATPPHSWPTASPNFSLDLPHVLVDGGASVYAWVQQIYRDGDSEWLSSAGVTAADDGIATADEINESATRKWAGESGADVTSANTAADTAAVAGTAAATVRDNAAAGATFTSTDAGAVAYLDQITDVHIQDGAVVASKLASAIAYSGRFEAKGGDGVTKAGMAGGDTGDTAIRMWAGADYANRGTAPFRVTQGGDIYMEQGFVGPQQVPVATVADLTERTTQDAVYTVASTGGDFATVQAAIDALPRIVDHTITIQIDTLKHSVWSEAVSILRKGGFGSIKITTSSGNANDLVWSAPSTKSPLWIGGFYPRIEVRDITFEAETTSGYEVGCITAHGSKRVIVWNCKFQKGAGNTGYVRGILAIESAWVYSNYNYDGAIQVDTGHFARTGSIIVYTSNVGVAASGQINGIVTKGFSD